jgi:hypothetical protein
MYISLAESMPHSEHHLKGSLACDGGAAALFVLRGHVAYTTCKKAARRPGMEGIVECLIRVRYLMSLV